LDRLGESGKQPLLKKNPTSEENHSALGQGAGKGTGRTFVDPISNVELLEVEEKMSLEWVW
jgi:hypothetical protein